MKKEENVQSPSAFLRFSHDRGSCFVRQELDSTGVFSLNRGLLVDPTAASRYTFVMGVEGVEVEDAWRVIALNFGSLLRTKCEPLMPFPSLTSSLPHPPSPYLTLTYTSSFTHLPALPLPPLPSLILPPPGQKSDYSLVPEHADSCLLGYKNVYNLTKSSSM